MQTLSTLNYIRDHKTRQTEYASTKHDGLHMRIEIRQSKCEIRQTKCVNTTNKVRKR